MGHNKALCIFNGTIFTNATIMEEDIMKCDSPSFLDNFGYSKLITGSEFYNLEVSISGGVEHNGPKKKFTYYKDPKLNVLTPDSGPVGGGTIVKINGTGFNAEGACNKTVRFATFETKPINETTDTIMFVHAPQVHIPDQVVVGVALNG